LLGGGITKTGNGTLVLTNTGNSYTGGTIINAGTLLSCADGVIPDASAVTVSGTGANVRGHGTSPAPILTPAQPPFPRARWKSPSARPSATSAP